MSVNPITEDNNVIPVAEIMPRYIVPDRTHTGVLTTGWFRRRRVAPDPSIGSLEDFNVINRDLNVINHAITNNENEYEELQNIIDVSTDRLDFLGQVHDQLDYNLVKKEIENNRQKIKKAHKKQVEIEDHMIELQDRKDALDARLQTYDVNT